MSEKTTYEKLSTINVKDKIERKNNLAYLSWAWAWIEFLKVCPDATYEVIKTPEGLPYFSDNSGACVFTTVTVDGITREMWLPVMDGANKAMKFQEYTFKDRYGKEKTVAAYTMFDINKTIMRCLTKNLAMFGLALYIYAGEDMPTDEDEKVKKEVKQHTPKTEVADDKNKAAYAAHYQKIKSAKTVEDVFKFQVLAESDATWNEWKENWQDNIAGIAKEMELKLKDSEPFT